MLKKILEHSRALFSDADQSKAYYYFDDLKKHIQASYSDCTLPSVIVVYSLNKLCETFCYSNESYIIYDRYLGQCFNKFNRLIFQENDIEVRAYLSKLFGEEYYLINEIEDCIPHLVTHHVNKRATIQDLPPSFLLRKTQLIVLQESFVLCHEFAHNLIIHKPNLIDKAKEFVERSKHGKLNMDILNESFGPSSDYEIAHFFEELTCDIIALELSSSFWLNKMDIDASIAMEGISLAFLYLRTLIDIKRQVSNKRSLTNDKFDLFAHLRYNLLREYYVNSSMFELAVRKPSLIELYEKWEEKIDMELVLFFNDEYKASLKNAFNGQKTPLNIAQAKELLNLPA